MNSKWLPSYLFYLLKIGLVLLSIFSLFRLIILFQHISLLQASPVQDILYAFFNRGLLFDIAISCYILSPVFLILALGDLFKINSKNYKRAAALLVFVLCSIALLLSCADIPYFKYYNSRLSKTILVLSENDSKWLIARDIFTNWLYLPYTVLFIAGSYFLWRLIKKANAKFILSEANHAKWYGKLSVFIISGFLLFCGLRGDLNVDALPLKIEHAYFTENTITNQLGLNASFSFMDSFREPSIRFMNEEEAIAHAQTYLNIRSSAGSPIARYEGDHPLSSKPNVILILVESLSAVKLASYGHPLNLMPFLDSLSEQSLTFRNVYTAGMHTHNGIFSTLTGMPSILSNTPMLSPQTSSKPFTGLATTLKSHAYSTIFFMSGKKNFDNMQGFLPINGFDELVSKENYPKKQWINRWGVPDHCIFDYSIQKLDSIADLGQPFLSTFMTISTHNPYSIPKGINFVPQSSNAVDKSYEYADWSIKRFFTAISRKPWFSNTIVAIIGDHGQNFDPIYDIPLSYHHTPMIFYSPTLIEKKREEKLGLQIDLFPTLMHLMQLPYMNNTLGLNLMEYTRPYVFFSSDDKIGCLNEDFFLIIQPNGKEALYRYKAKSRVNEIDNHQEMVLEMKDYTYSMLQTAQWLIDHGKTSPEAAVLSTTKSKK